MQRIEYDFLTWASFPSSLKLFNDEADWWFSGVLAKIGVTPGAKLTSKVKVKQENATVTVPARPSVIAIHGWGPVKYFGADIVVPYGTIPEWRELETTITIPSDITMIYFDLGVGAAPAKDVPSTVWYDDLKIYMDDVLIYDNYFTALRPGKVVPNVITPPEIIVGMVQRFKAGRASEETLHRPLAIASI